MAVLSPPRTGFTLADRFSSRIGLAHPERRDPKPRSMSLDSAFFVILLRYFAGTDDLRPPVLRQNSAKAEFHTSMLHGSLDVVDFKCSQFWRGTPDRKLPFHRAPQGPAVTHTRGTSLHLPGLRGRDFEGLRRVGSPSKLRRGL